MPAPPPDPFVSTAELQRAAVEQAAAVVPLLVASAEQAGAALDQVVRVVGVAEDSKLSAVVIGDALVVHCMERDEQLVLSESRWPEGTVGQQVAVTGLLVRSEQFAATEAPDGAISQGAEGSLFAVVDYTLELIAQPEAAAALPEPAAEPEPEPAADTPPIPGL